MAIEVNQHSPHLPHELIEDEILPKLPVKSLLRFRCISRRWRSLIDSKHFIRKQYQNSVQDSSLAHYRAFLIYHPSRVSVAVAQCPLLSLLLDTPPVFHPIAESTPNFPTTTVRPSLIYSINVVGSCNGLLCVLLNTRVSNQQFVVWNPCTSIFKAIEFSWRDITNYGFYWDEAKDDYKVMLVILSDERWNTSVCKIYSLRKNSWKEIRAPDLSHSYCRAAGVSAGGRLHWLGFERKGVVSFDLKSEAFEAAELPRVPHGYVCYGVLGSIGECLTVRWWFNCRIEVWGMKEYGVKESWELLFHFDGFNIFPSSVVRWFCMGREREILLHKRGIIEIYDWKRGNFVISYRGSHEADVYVESLVSPFDESSKPFATE